MGFVAEKLTVACQQIATTKAQISSASMQSDQHLCYSLSGKNSSQVCAMKKCNILASLCNWTDWFEFYLIRNPEDRFSRNMAHTVNSEIFVSFVFV